MWRKHRSLILWRRGPSGRNSQGLVMLDVPFCFAGPDRFQSFPCQDLIPTSGVNTPAPPKLAPPGPQLLPHLVPTQLPPLGLGSCFLFFFSANPTSDLRAVLGQVYTTPSNPLLLPQRAWLLARPTSPSEVDCVYCFIASCQNS